MYTGNDHSKMINSAICCQKNKCGQANIARSNLIKIQLVMLSTWSCNKLVNFRANSICPDSCHDYYNLQK